MKTDPVRVEQHAANVLLKGLHKKYCKVNNNDKYLAICTRHFIERLTIDRRSDKVNPREFCRTVTKLYQKYLCQYLYILERICQDDVTGFVRIVDKNLTLFICKRPNYPFGFTTVLGKDSKKSYDSGVTVLTINIQDEMK